jgi:acetolactate synthase-1/2/3 large subunit
MTGSQALVETLKQYGVEVIFGVPGDTSLPLYEALYDYGSGIRHVLARDERSASFMADAYARLSHKPGLCECPSGAGPLYSVPGVAEANASSIPVILFTSDIPLSGEGKQTITELDTQGLFGSIAKWTSVVKSAAKVPETVRRAFRIATSGRPGAVHLALPKEAMVEQVPDSGSVFAEPACSVYPAYRTRGVGQELQKLAEMLIEAERPVLVAGGGSNHSQAGKAITQLAEWLAMPVVTTISGQGVIPDHYPQALGVVGDNGYHPHAHQAVEQGDLLIYVGCKMGSVSTISWTMPSKRPGRKMVQIDLNPELLGNNFQNQLSINGDARLVLEDLLLLVKERTAQRDESRWLSELNQVRKEFWQDAEELMGSDMVPLRPERIVADLNRHLDERAIVIADAGTPTPYITRFLRLGKSGSRFLIPRSYGGLGYAIPALVGAHFACPGAKLVGLFGDGSLGMSAGELETLARLQIDSVLLHFSNRSFGWIKCLQKLHCSEKYLSVDFTGGDPCMVARGFGLKALQVETPDELSQAMDQAFNTKGPVFVNLESEPEVDRIPPVYSWQKAKDKKTCGGK